jgi:hypothetical protein
MLRSTIFTKPLFGFIRRRSLPVILRAGASCRFRAIVLVISSVGFRCDQVERGAWTLVGCFLPPCSVLGNQHFDKLTVPSRVEGPVAPTLVLAFMSSLERQKHS